MNIEKFEELKQSLVADRDYYGDEITRQHLIEKALLGGTTDHPKYRLEMSCYVDSVLKDMSYMELREEITEEQMWEIESTLNDF